MNKNDYYVLSNGLKIPKIGLGTWQVKDGEETYQSVTNALKAGYRHIDTAYTYENEKSIARAIKDSNVQREDIFITSKLPSDIKTYDGAMACFQESLDNLETDYLDLYLIHAPWPWSNVGEDCTKGNVEVWKAFVELYKQGKIKAIGVSNFQPTDIAPLIEATNFIPHVNQIRFFISNTQEHIVNYCKEKNILIEAYSPMATGKMLNDTRLSSMADKYNKTIAQICLRYCLQRNVLPLPKSVHEERIKANLDLDFTISDEDMNYLNQIENIDLKKPLRS